MEKPTQSPFVVGMRRVFKAMVWIFAIGILVQVFLAGLALFWNPAQWASHMGFSRILIMIPVLMLVVSFVARSPLSLRLRSGGLIGIVILLAVSAHLPAAIGYLSALHPVIAILLLVETLSIVRKTQ
ncbi:DUF6220 domain-containing protein [Paenibacillus sp. P26]|nr:DUF6220 domain-containing protein [Paenibacillus sp. P26]UUZ89961.1 DUF6220 domain-containing protein [Paenibacillus sp. P25]